MKVYKRKGNELKSELITTENEVFTFKIGDKEQNTISVYHKNGKLIINTDSFSDMVINNTASNSFEILFLDSI